MVRSVMEDRSLDLTIEILSHKKLDFFFEYTFNAVVTNFHAQRKSSMFGEKINVSSIWQFQL